MDVLGICIGRSLCKPSWLFWILVGWYMFMFDRLVRWMFDRLIDEWLVEQDIVHLMRRSLMDCHVVTTQIAWKMLFRLQIQPNLTRTIIWMFATRCKHLKVFRLCAMCVIVEDSEEWQVEWHVQTIKRFDFIEFSASYEVKVRKKQINKLIKSFNI